MVRVGAKPRVELNNKRTPKLASILKDNKILGKRSTSKPIPETADNDGQRSSKRAKKTAVPYQAPESIDTVLKAIYVTSSTPFSRALPSKSTINAKIRAKKQNTTPATKSIVKSLSTKLKKKTPVKQWKKTQKPKPVTTNKKQAVKKSKVQTVIEKSVRQGQQLLKKGKQRKAGTIASKPRKNSKASQVDTELNTASVKTTNNNKSKKRVSKKEALNPKPHVTMYDKDPTIYSKLEIPHISTLAHSRLIFRAIAMNDGKLLKKLVTTDASLIYSLCVSRSPMGDKINPLPFAVKLGNKEAIKMLVELDESLLEKKLGSCPDLLIEAESTGYGSKMMFGHGLRQVTVGRGGKEGNAAFLKDSSDYNQGTRVPSRNNYDYIIEGIEAGMSSSMLDFCLSIIPKENESSVWRELLNNIERAMRHGNVEIVGRLISMAVKKGGYGFNFLHEQAVTHKDEPFTDFKPVSVVKKSTFTSRVTPIHCAAINPNPYYLETLLDSKPEYTILDRQNWMPIHYSAVCVGVETLKLLLSRGASTTTPEKGGNTPLHLASSLGRVKNVTAILEHESKNVHIIKDETIENEIKGKSKLNELSLNSSLEKVNKLGMRPLHVAVQQGHVEVVKVLLTRGADADKFTPAQFEKLTPLMIACQYGHLDVVKLLVSHGVKVAVTDRRGRTAIFHAVINGHANVLSYLLRLGVNSDVTDSSGNTLAHYAAAYGWFFNLKLLLEAGCDVVKGNDWKLTPLAIAFMKGHIGIVEMLVKQPGVEVNTPVDGDSGMTLLLTACASTTLKSSLIPRLKFLVEELKANCTVVDFNGKNALHHLASHILHKDSENFSLKLQNLLEAAKFLIDRGCDLNCVDLNNQSPLMVACSSGNYWLAQKFIDWGVKLNLMVDSDNEDTVLHILVNGTNLQYAKLVYEKLANNADNLKVLKNMAQARNQKGFTPLFQIFNELQTQSDDEIPHVTHFVKFLVNKLDSDVNATVMNKQMEVKSSILHKVVSTNYATTILPILQTKNLNLDPIDEEFRTPLATLIVKSGKVEVGRKLIEAGAKVNFVSKNDDNVNLLLLLAMKQPKLYPLIPQMIAKGADYKAVEPKTNNSVLHYVVQNPKDSFTFEAIQALVKAGANVNAENKDGRTPLHLIVNARGNETDVEYEAEDFLLSSGADLSLKDIRGRTPLHYVFVKIGKPFDKSYLDPIELVTILLNSSHKNATQLIKMPDSIQCATPLHYAAMRGSTICCSYFINEMKGNLDVKDLKGNTPFGLAVYSGHEGSSLHFQQQGANFLQLLDTNIQIVKQGDITSKTAEYEDGNNESDNESNNSYCSNSNQSNSDAEKQQLELTIVGDTDKQEWVWGHKIAQNKEINKVRSETMKYPIFQEVVKKEWQGILHLMLAKLHSSGESLSVPVATALKTQKLRLALKLIRRVKDPSELEQRNETLLHTLALNSKGNYQTDLQVQVLKLLIEKGVSPSKVDQLSSHSVIYAAMNQNLCLIMALEEIGVKPHQVSLLPSDQLGRTPFSALFWKMNEYTNFSTEMAQWASSLLSSGSSANVLSKYPFVLSPYPTVRCLIKYHKDYTNFPFLSPLIVAVIHGRYDVVSWLIRQKSHPVNLNFGDENGRTALMHACRLNDLKMVKMFFNPHSYDHKQDQNPWTSNYSNWTRGKSGNGLNVNLIDGRGWTAVDYIVCPSVGQRYQKYSYANVEQLLTILLKAGASFTTKSGDGISPLERSVREKQFHIVNTMHKLLKTPVSQQTVCKPDYYGHEIMPSSEKQVGPTITNFIADAKKTAADKEAKIDTSNVVVLPDPLLKMEPDNAEVVTDTVQGVPFDCIMTQVDLSYGMSGLYNFYKMQLVKQPRGKKLVLLLTCWGRVGMEGQHQKTPFPTVENGIEEFKKIFKSKSGNNWHELQAFQPVPKKYRLVHRDLTSQRPSEISVDFDKLEKGDVLKPSVLQEDVRILIKGLTMVHKLGIGEKTRSYYRQPNTSLKVSAKLPIISTEVLQKADALLNRIKVLLAEKHKMHHDHFTASYSEEERLKIFDKLVDASEEYYALVPVYGFASEALQPIFEFNTLNERQEEIYKLIHLGFAKELLLAAEFNSTITNPYDYIYRCLGTSLAPLNMMNEAENFEGQLILQYISSSSPKTKVEGIYRVHNPKEQEPMVDNRWLLWHGTKSENVLSILHSGLQIAPLCVDRMGELFGKGIYFADTFSKSSGYTSSSDERGSKSKCIFLCEVALGKIQDVRINSTDVQNHKPGTERMLPKGFHSSKTADSRFIPDPAATICWNGKFIPLGPCVEQVFKKNQYCGLHYNEYIIFNPKQVKLRYLVEFH